MRIKSLILAVLEAIIKVVILAVAVMYILKGVNAAYEFGYKVFADEPVSVNNPRTITVGVGESSGVKDVASMLEDKGLINDARLFVIQEYLSAYHDQIKPGIYDLSTGMTANEMIQIMASGEDILSDDDKASGSVEDESGDTLYDEGLLEGEEGIESEEGMEEGAEEDVEEGAGE